MNKRNREQGKYGLGAANFALALSGTVLGCLLIGTVILWLSGYDAEARLTGQWAAGFASLSWFFLLLSPVKPEA